MREIKFSAWHIEKKMMFPVLGFNDHEVIEADVYDIKEASYYIVDDEDELISRCRENSYGRKEVILLQYTGLKDKNEEEIYEGDILENTDPGSRGIGVVEWGKSRGGFTFRSASFHHMYAPAWEVIGNIYENPELLKS